MNILLSCFLLFAYLGTGLFFHFAQNTQLIDKPNDRNLHLKPTVRGGGLIFIGLALLAVPLLCFLNKSSFQPWIVLWTSWLLLAGVNFWDDCRHLSVKFRFLVQSIIALSLSIFLLPQQLDFILFTVTNPILMALFIFFMVLWAINHFNFMDGLDGFCASQAIFLLLAYGILFYLNSAVIYQQFCLILMCTVLGFLKFNFPPAKLFMGDIGSGTLGLIIFSMALIGQRNFNIPILYWFILNGLFLFDSSITLIRRMLNQESWLAPHKKHAYQRLKQYGLKTSRILFSQLLVNLSLALLIYSYTILNLSLAWCLLIEITLLTLLYSSIEILFPMQNQI